MGIMKPTVNDASSEQVTRGSVCWAIALWGTVLKGAGKQGQLASHTHEKDMTTVRSQMGIFSQTTDPLVQNEI